jgi:hypothetical protein
MEDPEQQQTTLERNGDAERPSTKKRRMNGDDATESTMHHKTERARSKHTDPMSAEDNGDADDPPLPTKQAKAANTKSHTKSLRHQIPETQATVADAQESPAKRRKKAGEIAHESTRSTSKSETGPMMAKPKPSKPSADKTAVSRQGNFKANNAAAANDSMTIELTVKTPSGKTEVSMATMSQIVKGILVKEL